MTDREVCPVIEKQCEYYFVQYDQNGEPAICFCNHKNNSNDMEGNCIHSYCPLIK